MAAVLLMVRLVLVVVVLMMVVVMVMLCRDMEGGGRYMLYSCLLWTQFIGGSGVSVCTMYARVHGIRKWLGAGCHSSVVVRHSRAMEPEPGLGSRVRRVMSYYLQALLGGT